MRGGGGEHGSPKSPVLGLCVEWGDWYDEVMTISPMQLRLAAAYSSVSASGAGAASGSPSALEGVASARTEVADRVELSPTARMQQRIRQSLLAGRVDGSILKSLGGDEPAAGEARAALSAIAMHRSAAAANAAATGVAAGATFDATA